MLSTSIMDALFDERQKCHKREKAFIVVVAMFATITLLYFLHAV